MNRDKKERVILFGVGKNYSDNRDFLEKRYNIIALCDNSLDKQGKIIDGYKCIAPADIVNFDYDKVIIIPDNYWTIYEQLLESETPKNKIVVYSYYVKLGLTGEIIEIPFDLLESFKRWAQHSDDELSNLIRKQLSNINDLALQSYDSLQDDESRQIYAYLFLKNIVKIRHWNNFFRKIILETLKNRLLEKGKDLSEYDNYDNNFFFGQEYFSLQNEEWMNIDDDEIFIDCGAYDGNSIKDFVKYCDGKYKKIYSFEPIPNQFENTVKNINEARIKNVEILQKGVWSYKSSFNFTDNTTGSRIANDGTIPVEVISIDEVIPKNEKVTFIKMDIEGAELEALKGAVNTIRRCKPKLAVCIYHKPSDIIEIPTIIKYILPEYRFYIRHHTAIRYSSVLYALP